MSKKIIAGLCLLATAAAAVWLILRDEKPGHQQDSGSQSPLASSRSEISDIHSAEKVESRVNDKDLTLQAGGAVLRIVFPDGITTAEKKSLITKDLNWMLRFMKEHDRIKSGYPSEIQINGRPTSPVGQLNFTGSANRIPREALKYLGLIVDLDGEEALVVPTELISIYESAFALLSKHPGAMEGLDEFIERLNGRTTPENYRDLISIHASAMKHEQLLRNMAPDQFNKTFKNHFLLRPGILQVRDGSDEGVNLVAPLFFEASDGLQEEVFPAIYQNNQWKLLLGTF